MEVSQKIRIQTIILFSFMLAPIFSIGQTEKFPIFDLCKNKTIGELPKCFNIESKLLFF